MISLTEIQTRKAGRPKGTANLGRVSNGPLSPGRAGTNIETHVKKLVEEVIRSGVKLPLIFLMETMNNPAEEMQYRIDCAKAVMPYIHRKMPVEMEVQQQTSQTNILTLNVTAERFKDLTDDELKFLSKLAERVAPPGPDRGGVEETEAVEVTPVLPGPGTATEGTLSEAPGVLQAGGGAP